MRAIPAPLRTLALTWSAVSLCGAVAIVAQIAMWIFASPWRVALAVVCLGLLIASTTRRRARSASPIPAGPRPGPHSEPPPTGTTTRTPRTTTRTPAVKIVYYAGRRIGVMTADGRVRLDSHSHRAG
jgi:hypothetical protein